MSTSLTSDQYDLYDGDSPAKVLEKYNNLKNAWTGQLFSWRSRTISIDPFNTSCVGIVTRYRYDVEIQVISKYNSKPIFML